MNYNRLYDVAKTGIVPTQPTPVDNVMQQYQPQQPKSFWQKTKDFAGSTLGRNLLGGLGTALAVGLSGGDTSDALSYGVIGAGNTMDTINKRNQYQDEINRKLQERADKIEEAEKGRQLQKDLANLQIQANADAADLAFERRLQELAVSNQNEIDKMNMKNDLEIAAKEAEKEQTRQDILNSNLTPEQKEYALGRIGVDFDEGAYYSNVLNTNPNDLQALNYFKNRNTARGIIDPSGTMAEKVKLAKDGGFTVDPEALNSGEVVYARPEQKLTGDSLLLNTLIDKGYPVDQALQIMGKLTPEQKLAYETELAGVKSGYNMAENAQKGAISLQNSLAIEAQKSQDAMKLAEFKNSLPTDEQKNIEAQAQAMGVAPAVLYQYEYDKIQSEINKNTAMTGNTLANMNKTNAEIPFIGKTNQILNDQYLMQNPERADSPAFKKAGTTVNINGDETQNKYFNQEMGKSFADEYKGIQDTSNQGMPILNSLNQITEAVKRGKAYQGTGGNLVNAFKKGLSSLGVNVEGLDDAAIINSGRSQLMGGLRKDLMPGPMSDRDIQFLSNMAPGLDKTPEQNRAILNLFTKAYQRQNEAAEFARQYLLKNHVWDVNGQQQMAEYFADKPIFSEQEKMAVLGGNSQPNGNLKELSDNDLMGLL